MLPHRESARRSARVAGGQASLHGDVSSSLHKSLPVLGIKDIKRRVYGSNFMSVLLGVFESET